VLNQKRPTQETYEKDLCTPTQKTNERYLARQAHGVALASRIDKIIGLFCKRALQKRQYSAKETYNFIDPTDRSHPIVVGSRHVWHSARSKEKMEHGNK